MTEWKKMAAETCSPGNPHQWLEAYLRQRAELAACESDFHCEPACTRPGCKNLDLQVQVSLVDLVGAEWYRGESVAEVFRRHHALGLFADGREDWIRRVSIRLRKPCPFLENERCGIYPVRPLPCILFPEYLVYEGKLAVAAGKEHFADFLCLRGPVTLSPERAKIMAHLMNLFEQEGLISSFYLFGSGHCHFDFSDLTRELLDAADGLGDGEAAAAGAPPARRIISNQVLERFFQGRIGGLPPFAGIIDRIEHLEKPAGLDEFLRLLQDARLLRELKQGDGRVLVFRFKKGRLEAARRSLLPREYHSY